jgi:hypothetical protein
MWVASLAAVVVAGVLVWLFVFRDSADPVPVGQAVTAFREGETGSAVDSGGPEPGVYVYSTEGFEEIDALLGARHDYPPETTITVTPGGCGTLLRWDALEGRSTTWELCPAEAGLRLAGYSEEHRFFGQTEHTEYHCEPPAPWTGGYDGATRAPRTCSTPETQESSSVSVLGRGEPLDVEGETVPTLHVLVDLALAGRTRGTGLLEAWLRDDGLPARLVLRNDNRSDSAIGDVEYAERATLALTSSEPRQ